VDDFPPSSLLAMFQIDSLCYAVHMGKDFRWWMVPLALAMVILVLWILLSFDSGNVLPHEYDVYSQDE
jgi:hypothetical protein